MPGPPFSNTLEPGVGSAAAAGESVSSTEASTVGHRSAKQPRHVAFLLERDPKDKEAAEAPRAARLGWRSSVGVRPAEERRSLSGRAETDALRQRALQCGEDFLRVASGLGYEVVAHTPMAFLKRGMTDTTAVPVAVARPEKHASPGFASSKSSTMRIATGAAPRSSPSVAATTLGLAATFSSHGTPAFLLERDPDSCSSRSSSLGTEERVGMVPVLSPLLHGGERCQRRLSIDAPLRGFEVQVPRTTGGHALTSRYPATFSSSHSLQEVISNYAADGNVRHTSPQRYSRAGFGAEHRTNDGANPPAPATLNNPRVLQSTPITGRPLPLSGSPSPHPALPPRTVFSTRGQPVSASLMAPGPQNNTFAFRLSMLDVTSSHATSNVSTSVSTEHLNGHEFSNAGGSQNTNNRFVTPFTDVLNTPVVRITDDDDWPRTTGRSIQ
ncbi:hypothetical protein JKF63_00575 [Porcisia hertigi]|uniref:Uncharacterized protein n=1 Tax=Porcisia hertigi TaxID=2761500 RepID=A0A836HTT2_9TRYP|nr:hypothetical protein JKF63_00575 [Porcisia hertigi]